MTVKARGRLFNLLLGIREEEKKNKCLIIELTQFKLQHNTPGLKDRNDRQMHIKKMERFSYLYSSVNPGIS